MVGHNTDCSHRLSQQEKPKDDFKHKDINAFSAVSENSKLYCLHAIWYLEHAE